MFIAGHLIKPDRTGYWGVEIQALDILTQGKTRRNAHAMAKEAVELLAEAEGYANLNVTITPAEGDVFFVGSDDPKTLIAFILRRLRKRRGLTIEQVANRMGSASKNAYARYEQGKSAPSFEKLDELLNAIDPGSRMYLNVA
ncbi:MAG: type II toxin-antitoxin system HicB family antitoxin [Nitrospinae bacterium]|nr:type II toxin-antitoxin system HicB family antitoxin [Nitrospinota bacterium]